jgi:hypothetical protein
MDLMKEDLIFVIAFGFYMKKSREKNASLHFKSFVQGFGM